jgi:hypothetical protein
MGEALHGTFFGTAALLAVVFWVRAVYASVKAAANRKPGVGFFAAFNTTAVLFSEGLYTSEGLKWCATYRRCISGFVVTIVAAIAVEAIRGSLH